MANLKGDTNTTTTSFEGRRTLLGDRLQTAIDGDLDDVDSTQCVG